MIDMLLSCRLTSALQPRRVTIAPSAVGCKRWLCGLSRSGLLQALDASIADDKFER